MPAKSEKQEKFMRAVAHSPSFAKKVGVPMSVGREFTKSGGGMPVRPMTESKIRSKESDEDKRDAVTGTTPLRMPKTPTPAKSMAAMKKGGMAVKKYAAGGLAAGHKSADGIASKGKTKAKQITMAGSKGMKKGGMCK